MKTFVNLSSLKHSPEKPPKPTINQTSDNLRSLEKLQRSDIFS